MRLHFLGRGSAFCSSEGTTSAFLREDNKMLLIDCGETTFERLQALNAINDLESLTVLITHLHSDHVGSLATLASYCYYSLHFPLTIALPMEEKYRANVQKLLELMGSFNCCTIINIEELQGFNSFTSVRYVKTIHAPDMDCYSLIFETADGDVFYSGDTSVSVQLEEFIIKHSSFETIYIEASLDESPASIHLPLSKLCKFIPPEQRNRVFIMHLASMQVAQAAAKEDFQIVPLVTQTSNY